MLEECVGVDGIRILGKSHFRTHFDGVASEKRAKSGSRLMAGAGKV